MVVVVIGCRPMTFGAAAGNSLLNGIAGLLMAWRPGSEGGRAIVDLLFGAIEPSGRLAQSWIRAAGQAGSSASPWLQERRSGCTKASAPEGAERRFYDSYADSANAPTPLFHFGYGLSYASHQLSNLSIMVASDVAGPSDVAATVTLAISDVSGRPAPAVLQLYVQDPVGAVAHVRPWKRLVGFRKVVVPGSGVVRLELGIRADDLAFVGDDMRLRLHQGKYVLSAGFSSNGDAGHAVAFKIPADVTLQKDLVRPGDLY